MTGPAKTTKPMSRICRAASGDKCESDAMMRCQSFVGFIMSKIRYGLTLRDEPRRVSHAVGSIAMLDRFRDICGVFSDCERSGYQLRVFTRHSRIPRGVPSRPRLAWCGLDVGNKQAGL